MYVAFRLNQAEMDMAVIFITETGSSKRLTWFFTSRNPRYKISYNLSSARIKIVFHDVLTVQHNSAAQTNFWFGAVWGCDFQG